jgi:hypothetical protein
LKWLTAPSNGNDIAVSLNEVRIPKIIYPADDLTAQVSLQLTTRALVKIPSNSTSPVVLFDSIQKQEVNYQRRYTALLHSSRCVVGKHRLSSVE